jgi:hypothetical protein
VRATLLTVYGLYGLAVVVLVWSPSAATPSSAVTRAAALLARLGFSVEPTWVEFGLNIVMLVPLSLIGGLLLPRLSPSDWLAIGFGLSVSVEAVQRLVLPRSGTARDVVANTFGCWFGAVLLMLALTLWTSARPSMRRGGNDGGDQDVTL